MATYTWLSFILFGLKFVLIMGLLKTTITLLIVYYMVKIRYRAHVVERSERVGSVAGPLRLRPGGHHAARQ